jgi:fatty acid desaturase
MSAWLSAEALAALMAALALGAMTFFSFAMAPLVFRTLERDTAARFMGAAFPVYYRLMAALTGAAAVLGWSEPEALPLAVICAVFVYLWLVFLPRVNRYRDARMAGDEEAARSFSRLHRISVIVNLALLAILLASFLSLVA